jgi:multicomponent Na+:H+ antiporter subunit D
VLSCLILIPLLVVILLNLPCDCMRRGALPLALLMAVAQAVAVVFGQVETVSGFLPLVTDDLSRMMLLAIGVVAFAALLVGRGTIPEERKQFDFINLVILSWIGMNGIVLAIDLFTVYVFIEVASVASFIMIALHKDGDGLEGALKYIVMSAIATIMMLASIALFVMLAGSTYFTEIGRLFGSPPLGEVTEQVSQGQTLRLLAVALFLGGMFIKSGLVPFHGWLPDAYMAAPAGVSVLLGGIVTKTTGVYILIRLLQYSIGIDGAISSTLLLAGTLSIVVGALVALVQSDFKRMLAYSSISQVGYIIVSLATGSTLGLAGAIFHAFNHAIFKSQLFVNAAAVEKQVGTRNMDQLGGLSDRMPVTGTTALMALLSTAGVPPFAGFWSKLVIIVALWQSGHTIYALIAVLASVLTLAYFLLMLRRVFYGKLREGLENIQEASLGLTVPAVVLTLITIGVGVLIPFIFGTFVLPANGF